MQCNRRMNVLIIGFALILLAAGVYHFVNPALYYPFMPAWFPKPLANAAGGAAEIVIGILMLVPSWRTYGLWAACGLMIVFLPLHVIDLLRPRPVIGGKGIAAVRLVIQFILIGWLWLAAAKN